MSDRRLDALIAELKSVGADVLIVYDGDCVFCSNYMKLVRLRSSAGEVKLINARDPGVAEAVRQHLALGLDEGMLVITKGRYFYGSEALTALSMMTSGSGFLNTLSAKVFSSPTRANILYPFMKMGRAVTLKALGRTRLSA